MFARLRENGYGMMSLNTGRNWSTSRPLGQNVLTVVISADVSIALQCSPGGSILLFFLSFSFPFFLLICGGTQSLRMPPLRPASQAVPLRNPRKGLVQRCATPSG